MFHRSIDRDLDNRLRFVFGDTVVSYRVAADTTFEDIARRLGALAHRRHGHPVAIDITIGSHTAVSASSLGVNGG